MSSKKEDQISQLSWYCSFVFRRSQVYISIWRLANMSKVFNPLKAKLNPICHLLALLGAHHMLSVSRIRVN
jgi:hypothetical protein